MVLTVSCVDEVRGRVSGFSLNLDNSLLSAGTPTSTQEANPSERTRERVLRRRRAPAVMNRVQILTGSKEDPHPGQSAGLLSPRLPSLVSSCLLSRFAVIATCELGDAPLSPPLDLPLDHVCAVGCPVVDGRSVESEYLPPMSSQYPISLTVAMTTISLMVRGAVSLDCQANVREGEIDEVPFDAELGLRRQALAAHCVI